MVIVTNIRKVVNMKEEVKVIRGIESGNKHADVCREFGFVNSLVQTIWQKRQNSVLLNKMITNSEITKA
jgi:stage III sporulation protein SpoIIIAA